MSKRVVSLWFPRLASDRALRVRPVSGPFALTLHERNTDRLYCLNSQAGAQGLSCGMGLADARAICPDLQTRPADPPADARFLRILARWATRYCPWVGLDGRDGLSLDITGSAHLVGGEAALLDDLHMRLTRAGLHVRSGLADTRGAAWAIAHYGNGIAPPGAARSSLAALPVPALRLPEATVIALQRLGLRTIGELLDLPRASLTRRFGRDVVMRLDQALGDQPEQVSPLPDPPRFAAQMTLPEPIGLTADVMAGTGRLLEQVCTRLAEAEAGARALRLTLRRVDQASCEVELRLARPLRDARRILPLFERGVSAVDAGFGIDQLRLEATRVDPLPAQQLSPLRAADQDTLNDLITRIGSRIGLDNIRRFLPADSHIPERAFLIAPAAYSDPSGSWVALRPRPLRLFAPEPIAGQGPRPPRRFRWRRMSLSTGRATGPERIAPEWWLSDESWRTGMRDYWQVETRQGRRLWMYYTPQSPGWFVQGEFA